MTKLHTDLLLALRGAGQYGIGTEQLLTDMRSGRHRELALPELEKALRDLADRSFARVTTSTLGIKRWRLTGLGLDALGEEGL